MIKNLAVLFYISKMNKIRNEIVDILPAMRISIALVMITASLLLIGDIFGFAPSQRDAELKARKAVTESIAVQFSILANANDPKIYRILETFVKRDETILSAGIRNLNGALIYQVNNHEEQWDKYSDQKSTATNIIVPILKDDNIWANIEFKFSSLPSDSFPGIFKTSIYKLIIFIIIYGFIAYLFFILRTLKLLDPSAVIPERVNAAFDTLTEGVLILDEKEQIVLANNAFADKLAQTPKSLLGRKASELKWKDNADKFKHAYPWLSVIHGGECIKGFELDMFAHTGTIVKYIINCAPIFGKRNKPQGVLITFDDITELDKKNSELVTLVSQLEAKKIEVTEQNKELEFLATRDPLTGCLNRRSFYAAFELEFAKAKNQQTELSCIMVDIDHFKAVNDKYGHATGDEVIKLLADILLSTTRKHDLVGRYGGEEFCLVLPGLSADNAIKVAERIRFRLKNESSQKYADNGPVVTASVGVASIFDNVKNIVELNDFADKALYVAKQTGRNRVIRWDQKLDNMSKNDVEAMTLQSNYNANPKDNFYSATTTVEEITQSGTDIEKLQMKINELEDVVKNYSEKLQHSMYYDDLTNLPNHALFYDRISQAINRGSRNKYLAAVLSVDVSLFKEINISLGRSKADHLLKILAQRLEKIIRKSDAVTLLQQEFADSMVSRFGADEFGILITDLKSKESTAWIINRIVDEITQPIEVYENNISIACNIGVSLFPIDGDNPEQLIRHSLTAKQYAKSQLGVNKIQYYNKVMHEVSISQMQLEMEMRVAIEDQQWMLYYQPKVDVLTGKCVGVEALIRWNHPEKGILSPFYFLDYAEKRGFIYEIGKWVTRTAFSQVKEWLRLGIKDVKVSINMSGKEIQSENFEEQFFDLLNEIGLPPRHVELEITETTLIENRDYIIDLLSRLRCRGIAVSLDDFGSGYSSLSYLKHLPVDIIKIDRSFIQNIADDEYDKNIVKSVIALARNLNLQVVAEGIETEIQYDLLKSMSCDIIQGYLYSKPLPVLEATNFLLKN